MSKDVVIAEPVDGDPLADKRKREQEGAKEGEYVPAGEGYGSTADDHTSEIAANKLRGKPKDVDLSTIDADWVMRRLVKEATDFGTRTRQSSRVKALELIGSTLGLFDKTDEEDDPIKRRAMEMTPAERRERIQQLARDLKMH